MNDLMRALASGHAGTDEDYHALTRAAQLIQRRLNEFGPFSGSPNLPPVPLFDPGPPEPANDDEGYFPYGRAPVSPRLLMLATQAGPTRNLDNVQRPVQYLGTNRDGTTGPLHLYPASHRIAWGGSGQQEDFGTRDVDERASGSSAMLALSSDANQRFHTQDPPLLVDGRMHFGQQAVNGVVPANRSQQFHYDSSMLREEAHPRRTSASFPPHANEPQRSMRRNGRPAVLAPAHSDKISKTPKADDAENEKRKLKEAKKKSKKETRDRGACARCWLQKGECIIHHAHARLHLSAAPSTRGQSRLCEACKKAQPQTKSLGCVPYRVLNIEFLDKGIRPRETWTQRWVSMSAEAIIKWSCELPEISVYLTQGIGDAAYQVQVRSFQPIDGDALTRRWRIKGKWCDIECLPVAITDMKAAVETIKAYVQDQASTYLDHYTTQKLDGQQDPKYALLTRVYQYAWAHSSAGTPALESRHTGRGRLTDGSRDSQDQDPGSDVLTDVIHLFVGARMENQREKLILDPQLASLSMSEAVRASRDQVGTYLAPVMAAQVEVATSRAVLLPKQQAVRKQLNDIITEYKPQKWTTLFLCTFIMLHNYGMLMDAEKERFIRESQEEGTEPFHNPSIVRKLHDGAMAMLFFFHYRAKGCISLDKEKLDSNSQMRLTAEQRSFMRSVIDDAKALKPHFAHVRREKLYSDHLYYVGQMFEEDWSPSVMDLRACKERYRQWCGTSVNSSR